MPARTVTKARPRGPVGATVVKLRAWPYTFAVVLSIGAGALTLSMSSGLDLPLRDPEGFLGPAYVRLPVLGLLFIAGGIVLQSLFRARSLRVLAPARRIIREDWTWGRLLHVALGLVTFYVCYVSYRNLKSFLPIVRDDVLYDTDLMRLDHALFLGHYPGIVLQQLLGNDIAAQVLSSFYISYLALVPISLAALLVWSKDATLGAWYATALSLNWLLGVASYYALPTLGPAFADQSLFADLPSDTGVAALQKSLAYSRFDVLADPWATEKIHGIAGFASLHVSVVVTACLFLQRTRAHRVIRLVAWCFLPITITATVYFGWHYLADDMAGALIGWLAVVVGAYVTGNAHHHRRLEEIDAPTPPVSHATPQVTRRGA